MLRTIIVAAIVAVLLSAANSESIGPCGNESGGFSGDWKELGARNPYDNGGRNPYDNSTWSQPDPRQPYGGQAKPYPY
jgi:hypothetical protein